MATNILCRLILWITAVNQAIPPTTAGTHPQPLAKWGSEKILGPEEKTAHWPHSLLFIHDLISSSLLLYDAVSLWYTVVRFTIATSNATNSADSVTRDSADALWCKNLQRYKRTLF